MALNLWDKAPPVGVPNPDDPVQNGSMVRGRVWCYACVTAQYIEVTLVMAMMTH